jgi:hypothetical protein
MATQRLRLAESIIHHVWKAASDRRTCACASSARAIVSELERRVAEQLVNDGISSSGQVHAEGDAIPDAVHGIAS